MKAGNFLSSYLIFAVTFLASYFLGVTVFATEMKVRPGISGTWLKPDEQEDPSFNWKAEWIWLEENVGSSIMLARKSFELIKMPKDARLRISASSKYQLFVNGKYVCRGPARSAPHHQSYDILEISGLLHIGRNVIAIRVHHQDGKYSYHHVGRAGLLAQLDFPSGEIAFSVITDANWKVSTDASWDNKAPLISRFQQVVNDRVDMRKHLAGWQEVDFDDASWSGAAPLMRNVGWPGPQANAKVQALTPPWTSLVPRDIPYLKETNVKAINLIQAMEVGQSFSEQIRNKATLKPIKISRHIDYEIVKGFAEYKNDKKPLIIPSSDTPKFWLLLFDFGEVINGMPKLDIEGDAGTTIDILCAPFVVDNQFTYQVVDSEFLDRITLSGGKDFWESTYFKPTRYMGIVVQGGSEPVSLYYAGIHQMEYPFEKAGNIHAPDAPWVQHYFNAAAKTIKVCTTDGYTDNYRERRQYAQTGFYAALGNYWIFGDQVLQRRYLIQTAQEQEANGIMPAYAPAASDDYMIIMDSNCLWIRSLRNYLMYSGDYKTARELLPAAIKLMALLHSYTNSLGMINNPPYAYWLDHALNDRRGANLNLNGHYLGALEDFADLLEWLDIPEYQAFKDRAELLRKSLRTHLWDENRGLFVDALIDGEQSEMFSEHANAMALSMNVATPQQAEKIAKQLLIQDNHNYIKRASGITMVTPAMSHFLHSGLCKYGYIEASFELFRNRFDKMLQPNMNGTLWEEWWLDAIGRSGKLQKGRTRSDAQTESAFPPALFAEFLLGIKPSKPGMKEMIVTYKRSGLKHVEGTIPTPEGDLEIQWNTTNKKRELKLEIPGNMIVKVDLESFGIKDDAKIKLNGKIQHISMESTSFLDLSKGKQILNF